MIASITYFLIVMCILLIAHAYYKKYRRLQNNYFGRNRSKAIYCRNIAILCAILCIILLTAFVLNKDEFFSNNLNNCPMKEKSMQNDTFRAIQGDGPLTTEGIFYETT